MIRYWSNDYARLSSARCACGRTHVRAVGGIIGRHDDLIVFKGAKFYPSQVERVVRSFPELSDEFRIELDARGGMLVERCTVVCELRAEGVEVEPRLVKALRSELGSKRRRNGADRAVEGVQHEQERESPHGTVRVYVASSARSTSRSRS